MNYSRQRDGPRRTLKRTLKTDIDTLDEIQKFAQERDK